MQTSTSSHIGSRSERKQAWSWRILSAEFALIVEATDCASSGTVDAAEERDVLVAAFPSRTITNSRTKEKAMAQTLSTPSGRKVVIDASAGAVLSNSRTSPLPVSTATFDDGLEDTLFLPRDSQGIITLTVSLVPQGFPVDVTGRWTYSKQRSQLVFPSASLAPSGGIDRANVHGNVDLVSNAADSSVGLSFSLIWGDAKLDTVGRWLGADDDDERMDFAVKVSAIYEPNIILESLWVQRQTEFGPFETRTNRLEKGDLNLVVRDWFHTLDPDTQHLIEHAKVVGDMPADEEIQLDGYTSTLGAEKNNWSLAGTRVDAVLEGLRRVTGNNKIAELCNSPSRGEGPRATDVRRQENNDEKWRKVVVTYWDKK
jgi:hypothetical protein